MSDTGGTLFNNLIGIKAVWDKLHDILKTARLDAPCAVHSIMNRGIERRKISGNYSLEINY